MPPMTLAALVLSLTLPAQDPPAPTALEALPPPARAALADRLEAAGRASGAWDEGDRLAAAGLDWKAVFDDGVCFTPALGAATAQNLSLELELVGASAGDAALDVAASGPARIDGGAHVELERHGLVEHWSARERGLELWVRIDALPARGELVLEYRADGDLPLTALDGSRAEFVLPGVGGVAVDAVVGIDALGRTAAGSLRSTEHGLAFVLPAWFIESATLPLVVDPLVSTVKSIDLPQDLTAPDLAHDPGTDTWLCVWQLEFSASDTDIYGWRRDADGAPISFLTPIATSSAHEREPAVGCNPNTGEWVVLWAQEVAPGNHDLYGRELATANGLLGSTRAAWTGPSDAREPEVSDEWPGLAGDDDLLVVWNEDQGDLFWGSLIHPAVGGPFVSSGSVVKMDVDGSEVHVSASGGLLGRHLIVWQNGAAQGVPFLSGVVVSRTGAQLFSSPFLEADISGVEREPFAVSNGEEFWVAHVSELPGEDETVGYRHLEWGLGLDLVTDYVQLSANDGLFSKPSAALVGDQLLVAWQELQFIVSFLQFAAVDLETDVACEPETTVPIEVLGQFDQIGRAS